MGLLDWLKKRNKNDSSVTKGETGLPPESDVRPDDETVGKLRSFGEIVDIDRRACGPERTLTVLFYNDRKGGGIPVGYFCVQQCSGAYSGAGFRLLMLSEEISEPKAADYLEHDGYSGWIPGFFSEDFAMDIHANKRLEPVNLPEVLRDMSFEIGMRKPDGEPERFELSKRRYGEIHVSWSVGFIGNRNGAGGSDPVPSEFFRNHDLPAFAAWIAKKYEGFVSSDEIFKNEEIWTLFELCRETMNRS